MVSLSPVAIDTFLTGDDDSAVVVLNSNSMAARRRGSTILRNATILMSLLSLLVSVSAQAAPDPAKRGGSVMTNREAWKLYEKYLSAWNTTLRQRVSDERSNTNRCWKNSSPQKYW
jgi:hypothetical protein